MNVSSESIDRMPVVRSVEAFDKRSGNLLERLVFNHRLIMVMACVVATVILGWLAVTRLSFNASFEKMIPSHHPYIRNYLDNAGELRGLGNSLRVVVENEGGSIFDPKYQEVLKKINDDLFLTPGVDRAWVKSL
jgi:predicted RND superfamily exporter protein